MEYPRLHLLGLPTEIRMTIWRHIHSDILSSKENQWYEPPVTSWGGLAATSRTIHDEISEFWPRTMIPYHINCTSSKAESRVTSLARGLTISLFKDFRQLSIQLPIHQSHKPEHFFRLVAAGLMQLAPVLQDLRIFFVGEDGLGVSTHFLGCGLRVYSELSPFHARKLLREGSCQSERGVLFRALAKLYCLHNLVVSNANYPLLQTMIGHKPELKTLLLVTDPRSALYEHCGGPLTTWYPPPALQKLQISANAVLGAVNMVLKVIRTLRDLTFIIPSNHWQQRDWKWLEHDACMLMQNISMHARKLRRFRLCIEQPLREEDAGALLGAINQYLPNTSLQTLEVHATVESKYFGKELITALPKTLKRLYISQELIRAEDVVEAVKARYFDEERTGGHEQAGNLVFVGYEYFECRRTKLALLRLNNALLDRERNAHLFDSFEDSKVRFGGGSSRKLLDLPVEDIGDDFMSVEPVPEGALTYYEDQTVEHITEAEMVFHAEEAAKAEDRVPFLLIPESVEVGENDHWMTD
jgi:hypothetical protein